MCYVEKVKGLVLGDLLNEDIFIGFMIFEGEVEWFYSWIEEVKDKGVVVFCGGMWNGVMLDVIVMENVLKDCDVSVEEVFGFLFILVFFDDFDEVLKEVNNSCYGL